MRYHSKKTIIHPVLWPLCRLYKLKAKSDARAAAAAAEAEHPRDPATGRPLFVPATGRPPAHDRNRAGVPIGEYLYRMQCAPPSLRYTYDKLDS